MGARERQYPNTVTLWIRTDEVERKATWQRRTLDGVRMQAKRAAYSGSPGDTVRDGVEVLIPNVFSGYVATESLSDGRTLGLSEWTLRHGDRVVLGCNTAITPPQEAYTITGCEAVFLGRRVHHFEVVGR